MKFLDIPSLSLLSSALSYSSPECKVNTRIEAYSCKEVKKERRLRKELEEVWRGEVGGVDELSLSPEDKLPLLSSPLGSLSAPESRKLQFLLVSTLNLAYSDYDFSHLTPDDFEREQSGVVGVLAALSRVVQGGVDRSGSSPRSYGSYPTAILTPPQFSASLPSSSLGYHNDVTNITHPTLHRIMNDVISLDECVVYSYTPNAECDPHADDLDPDDEDLDLDGSTTIFGGDGDGESTMGGSQTLIGNAGRNNPYGHGHNYHGQRHEEDDENGRVDSETDDDMLMDMELDDEDAERKRRDRSVRNNNLGATLRYTAARNEGGLLWSINYFFYCKRQRRILFISVWARKRGSSFLAPQTPIPLTNPFKPSHAQSHTHSLHSRMANNTSMSMPSLTGLAASIQGQSVLGGEIAGGENIAPVISPRKTIAGAGPRRRRRSESVASNRSAVSIRARGKRLKV